MKLRFSATLLALTATAALLLALAPAASASDGVILINQATTTHPLPGCAGLTDGFGGTGAIVICQTGSYRLSGNIDASSFSGAEAILIVADRVTLDLNGFTVTAPPVSSGFGLAVATTNELVTVENGSVITSGSGIDFAGVNDTVRQVRVTETDTTDQGIGIYIGQGKIIDCTVSEDLSTVNSTYGIWIGQGSILDSEVSGTSVGVRADYGVLMSRLYIGYTNVAVQSDNGANSVIGASFLSSRTTDMLGAVVSQGNNICSNGNLC